MKVLLVFFYTEHWIVLSAFFIFHMLMFIISRCSKLVIFIFPTVHANSLLFARPFVRRDYCNKILQCIYIMQ